MHHHSRICRSLPGCRLISECSASIQRALVAYSKPQHLQVRGYVNLLTRFLLHLVTLLSSPFIMGGGAAAAGFDAALERRRALMGKSGPGALVKNLKVFRIALFACLGGVVCETFKIPSHSRHLQSCSSMDTIKACSVVS